MALYWAKRTPVPDGSGAEVYSFEPAFSLPHFSLKAFPQWEILMPLREFQPPQVMHPQRWLTAGVGGLVTNGIRWQPLQKSGG